MLHNSYLIVDCGYTGEFVKNGTEELTKGFKQILGDDKLIFLEDSARSIKIHNKDLCLNSSDFDELLCLSPCLNNRGIFCIYSNERKIELLPKQLDEISEYDILGPIKNHKEYKLKSGNLVTYIYIYSCD